MSDGFVADASVAIAWTIHSQATPATEKLREQGMEGALIIVPSLWRFEVANSLLMLERRGRIEAAFRKEALAALEKIEPEIDEEGPRLAFGAIGDLARQWSLTIYDATYLELAIRRGLSLASRDTVLNKAAKKCGVKPLL